jgi:hypothetical protein
MAKGKFEPKFGKYITRAEVHNSKVRSTALGRTEFWGELERLVQWMRGGNELGPYEALEYSLNDLSDRDKAELDIKGDVKKLKKEEIYNLLQRFNMRMRNELEKWDLNKKVEIQKMPKDNAIAIVGRGDA